MEKSFSTRSLAGQVPFSNFDTDSTFDTSFPTPFDTSTFDIDSQSTEVVGFELEDDEMIPENDVIEDEEMEEGAVVIDMQDGHATIDGVPAAPMEAIPDHNYPRRVKHAPVYYGYGEKANVAVAGGDPRTFNQALKSNSNEHWKNAMVKSLHSLSTERGS